MNRARRNCRFAPPRTTMNAKKPTRSGIGPLFDLTVVLVDSDRPTGVTTYYRRNYASTKTHTIIRVGVTLIERLGLQLRVAQRPVSCKPLLDGLTGGLPPQAA